ncbi:MAG: Rieske 2Fe-2S domain-containing protein [Actinomycetota bacterium]
MKPTGWFQIGWSGQLAVGEVKPMRYFGRELVAYRTEDGELVVLDAYCEHLGANMAYGGSVHGRDIQCPFHGWRWGPNGKNTCIPYQDAVNRVRRIGSWPTAEQDGVMYLWHHAQKEPPAYPVPSIFELFEGSGPSERYHPAYPDGTFASEALPVHPQYVIENGVDFAHFKYVHRADEIPEVVRREFGEHNFTSALAMKYKRKLPDGQFETVDGGVETYILGVGLGYSWAWGVGEICSITAVTPVDDETSVLWFTAWPSKESNDEVMLPDRRRSAINQLKADLAIWKHQRYTEPPGLATAEAAGFRDIRQWARRFYPEGHLGHAETDQLAATDAVGSL